MHYIKLKSIFLIFSFLLLFLGSRKTVEVKQYTLDGPYHALKFTFLDTNAFKKKFNPDSVVFGFQTPNWVFIKQAGQKKKYLNYTFFSKYDDAVHNRDLLPMDYYFTLGDLPSKVLKDTVYMEWPKSKVYTLLVDYCIAKKILICQILAIAGLHCGICN